MIIRPDSRLKHNLQHSLLLLISYYTVNNRKLSFNLKNHVLIQLFYSIKFIDNSIFYFSIFEIQYNYKNIKRNARNK